MCLLRTYRLVSSAALIARGLPISTNEQERGNMGGGSRSHISPEKQANYENAAARAAVRAVDVAAAVAVCNATSSSFKAGRVRSSSLLPCSVGETLQVVRLSNRTPRWFSRRRTASLSPDGLTCNKRAASRNPPAFATAAKILNALSSSPAFLFIDTPVHLVLPTHYS